ncbi:helix-turn-helix transcriptional regulator [Serratia marcescens]|nr:helix-turn-helix transcriptional regulator [Serratia marcescens]
MALTQRHAMADIDCTHCSLALTPREREVVLMQRQALPPSLIADLLNISIKTVSAHKRNAMRKLGFRRIHELQQWMHHELDYEPKQKKEESPL